MAISLLNRPNLEDGSASFYARWAVVGAGLVVSTILFRFLLPSLGSTAGAVTLLPILAAAMLLRTRCTIIAGVLACAAINAVTYFSFGTSWSLSSVVTGGATVIGVGVIVARLRELQDRVASAEQQRAIAEARARLSTAERLVSLGTLAAGIAHEVNNPLAFILANVRFARSSILEGHFELERAEVVKALEESEAGAMRMHAIVSDMKRLARDGAGDVGESDPRRVVESALNLISGEVKSAQVEKTYDPTPMVAASDARLGQIVLNLLTNALQSFATDSVPRIFSEARKFGLCLTTANQSLGQLKNGWGRSNIAESILANTATKFLFRLGPSDMETLQPYYRPQFSAEEMATLPDFHAVACMSDRNRPLPPFVMRANRPETDPNGHVPAATLVELSRLQYAVSVEQANQELMRLHDLSAESLAVQRSILRLKDCKPKVAVS